MSPRRPGPLMCRTTTVLTRLSNNELQMVRSALRPVNGERLHVQPNGSAESLNACKTWFVGHLRCLRRPVEASFPAVIAYVTLFVINIG